MCIIFSKLLQHHVTACSDQRLLNIWFCDTYHKIKRCVLLHVHEWCNGFKVIVIAYYSLGVVGRTIQDFTIHS